MIVKTIERSPTTASKASPWPQRIGIGVAGVLMLAIIAFAIASPALSRMAREHIIAGLNQKFEGNVEWKNLSVTVFPRPRIEAEGFTVYYKGRRDLAPLVQIQKITGTANISGMLVNPPHVSKVELNGLRITIPTRSERVHDGKKAEAKVQKNFVVDEIVADGTTLLITPKSVDKDPLEWDIRKLTLRDAGPNTGMTFVAMLTNAKPPGDIQSTGSFGPWQNDEPGDTPVAGKYVFKDADLSVFKGIAGILSSEGKYEGVLDTIKVEGRTDTPDFTVKVSGNPVHLITQFQAVVDGTNGNTMLQPVNFQVGKSSLTAKGGVEGKKGVKGKTVSLDVSTVSARLEDLMMLGVKGTPPMSGAISFHTKLLIPPGDVDVAQKLKLDGSFDIGSAHFSKLDVQEKVNRLSHSGSGEPETPATDTVASDFSGRFALDQGTMTFQNLAFRVPGVAITLAGHYGVQDQNLDFRGEARLEAEISQTTTGVKSFFLKAVDPFFKKKGAGALIPIKIGGTRDAPSFGLDLHLK